MPSMASCSCLVSLVVLGSATAYPGGFQPDDTDDQPFVCDYRSLAFEFAQKIQPHHDQRLTFDALMLGSLCNKTRPSGPHIDQQQPRNVAPECTIYVSVNGSDSNAGTSAKAAKKTVQAGLAATRKATNKVLLVVRGDSFNQFPFYLQ